MAIRLHRPKLLKATRYTVAWYVRLYPHLLLQRQAIIESSPGFPDVSARTTKVSDPTGLKVVRLEEITRKIDAIDHAKGTLPMEYRQPVWNNCLFGAPFPDYANIKTWKAYKNDFLYVVAFELGLPLSEND